MDQFVTLARDTNQARGIAQYALDMVQGRHPGPSDAVLDKVEQFHLDSVACGVSALAAGANAPTVLRHEALEYPTRDSAGGVPMFGSTVRVAPEKAVLACSSAVREWDANGTNFGYNPARGATAGEFGHNDFYPVAVAAAQLAGFDGRQTLVAMATLDEIRGRLAEVFALKNHKIDHVVHGAIASAAVYGAVLGATRRADRIGDRAGGGPLHSVSRDPARASAFGFEGGVGGDQRRSGRAEHAAGDARLRRAGRHLSQSAGDLLPVRAAGRATMQARSIWRWRRRATTSP